MTKGSGKHALEKDCIGFEMKKIHLGSSIAMFFFKQGVSDVLVEFNFNDRSVILEAVTPEKIKSGRCINGLSISSIQPEKKRGSKRWVFSIQIINHNKIINMNLRNLNFKGVPIAKDKIIFKDIPFLPSDRIIYQSFIIDMDNKRITHQSQKNNKGQSNCLSIGWIEKLKIEKERQETNQPILKQINLLKKIIKPCPQERVYMQMYDGRI